MGKIFTVFASFREYARLFVKQSRFNSHTINRLERGIEFGLPMLKQIDNSYGKRKQIEEEAEHRILSRDLGRWLMF